MQKTTRHTAAVAALAALGALAVLGAGSAARSATVAGATVSAHKTALGIVLVNAKGRTLYLFGKDRNGASACSGSCATAWPPLLAKGKPSAGAGVKAALLGTIRRRDGSVQVTYARHPLYTFANDARAGSTNGEGIFAFGAKWFALSARGKAVVTAPVPAPGPATTTTNATTTSPYGGY
jgi:predicted lipoprotein with Yx(FWY)xxD motif